MTYSSELELIIRKLMTDTQSTTAKHEKNWDEIKVAPDMRRIEEEAKAKLEALITEQVVKELEIIRTEQGGHNLEESCCELCDRINQLEDKK